MNALQCCGNENLYEVLYSNVKVEPKPFVSITGGGGKTTLLIGFARFLRKKGLSVLVTTTTKVLSPYVLDYGQDEVFEDEKVQKHIPKAGQVVFYAHVSDMEDKWCSPGFENISRLQGMYDIVLCEADGSRHLPIKVHTSRDPQVHPLTTIAIGVVGIWALGCSVNDVVFGPCPAYMENKAVDAAFLNWYFESPQGVLKDLVPDSTGQRIVLFNGADLGVDGKAEYFDFIKPKDVSIYVASARKGVFYGRL